MGDGFGAKGIGAVAGLLLHLLLECAGAAQDRPTKWGSVSPEDFDIDVRAVDSTAAAVVISDYGESKIAADWSVTYTRQRRIYLASESGYDFAEVLIEYDSDLDDVRKAEGRTYKLVDGKVERTKLRKQDVFQEEVRDSFRRVRFTLPALQPGAIVEYRYVIHRNNPVFLRGWNFQSSAPTLYSEYEVEIPPGLDYMSFRRGYVDFDEEKTDELSRPHGRVMRYTWIMRDVPAIHEEPYMTSVGDYVAGIDLQMRGFSARYGLKEQVAWSWEQVAKDLRAIGEINSQFRPPGSVREEATKIVAGLHDPLERMKAIYAFVQSTIIWNGVYDALPNQSLKNTLKTKTGSAADMSALLTAMLNSVDVKASPVLLSTRGHGRIVKSHPLLTQFNYCITSVVIGKEVFLLDATSPHRPYDLLPIRALNGEGWVITEDRFGWLPLTTKGIFKRATVVRAELDAKGVVAGRLNVRNEGYASVVEKIGIEERGEEAYMKGLIGGEDLEVKLDSIGFDTSGAGSDVSPIRASFNVTGAAIVANEFIYLNLFLVDRWDENPLKLEERRYPVDMARRERHDYSLTLALPDGYIVEELPPNLELRLPSGGALYRCRYYADSTGVNVTTRFRITRPVFRPREYKELKDFFSRVVDSHAQQVVLRRSD